MNFQLDSISLEEYKSLAKGNAGFMKILFEKVIRQITEYRPKIESSIRSSNLKQLREDTHHIKPMLSSLRMSNLLEVFEQIKQAMDSQTTEESMIESQIAFMNKSFDQIVQTLRVEIDNL